MKRLITVGLFALVSIGAQAEETQVNFSINHDMDRVENIQLDLEMVNRELLAKLDKVHEQHLSELEMINNEKLRFLFNQ